MFNIILCSLIAGNDDMRFDNVDFNSDFDPNEHDRKMKEIFNDEYYVGGEYEMQKPEFPEIDEELGIESKWDTYDPITDKIDMEAIPDEPHCEDPDFNVFIIVYVFIIYVYCCYILYRNFTSCLIADGC